MVNKLLLISWGTGGAEILNILYPILKETLPNWIVQNISISKFADNKLQNYLRIHEDDIINYIGEQNPTIVINERSNGLDVQNKVTEYCMKNGIRNITILDVHGNYTNRFTSLPNKILVPTKSIKKDMLINNFNEDLLVVTGNPSFDKVSTYKYTRKHRKLKNIIFTSQPIDAGNDNNTKENQLQKKDLDYKDLLMKIIIK